MLNIVLKEVGLGPKEIVIFKMLLTIGTTRASVLAYQTKLPRTTVQNILLRLEKKGLVEKILEEMVFVYTAINPDDLRQSIKNRKKKEEKKYDKMLGNLDLVMPELITLLSMNKGLPKIQLLKGRDAVRKVLFDTLTSKTELKGYVNVDAMFDQVKDINAEYVAAREKSNVKKRGILLDSPEARASHKLGVYSPNSYLDQKWVNAEMYPFTIEVNIYDGKVSFITYVENDFVGVIIENDHIYQMHASMWNLIWDLLPYS